MSTAPNPASERDTLVPLGADTAAIEKATVREAPLPAAQRVLPSAADVTSERMLRAQAEAPPSGWRRVLFQLSRGTLNPGPSAADVQRRELVARVKSPVAGCRRIAVVSRKGGVGKTTTTLMLGHTFASLRGDRVIALDGNPDAGSLAYRVRRETTNTITGLLAHRTQIQRYADIRAYTSQAPLRVLVDVHVDDLEPAQADHVHATVAVRLTAVGQRRARAPAGGRDGVVGPAAHCDIP